MLLQRVKPLARLLADRGDDSHPHSLKKTLGPWSLMAMGIGAIIGTGIFVLTGVAAATRAGPSLTISFIVAGIVSAFAALCYSEVASEIPIAGQRLHLHLCVARRVHRVDHRLGLGARIRARRGNGQHRMVRLLRGVYKECLWTRYSTDTAAKPLDRRHGRIGR